MEYLSDDELSTSFVTPLCSHMIIMPRLICWHLWNFAVSMVSCLHEAILTTNTGWVGCFIGISGVLVDELHTYSASGNSRRRTLDCISLYACSVLESHLRLITWYQVLVVNGKSPMRPRKLTSWINLRSHWASLSRPTRVLLQDISISAGSCQLSLHTFPLSRGTSDRHSCQWNDICSSLLLAPRLT